MNLTWSLKIVTGELVLKEMELVRRRMYTSLGLFIAVFFTGTTGYMIIEKWVIFDAFYMTVITVATIGYGEVNALSPAGRFFTVCLIFFGVGVVAYTVNTGIRFFLEGELQQAFGRLRLLNMISRLKDHYIICGYGRIGRIVAREFIAKNVPVVIVESQPVMIDDDEGILALQGNATKDETLKEAGIERARGVVAVLSTDADNLFVVLSARELNPALQIATVAKDEEGPGAEKKFLRAGANRVILPYRIGGIKIAQTFLKPAVTDFLELAMMSENLEIQIEQVCIEEGSSLANCTIVETSIGRNLGIIIVAVKKAGGKMTFNPNHKTLLEAGDTLIAMGEINRLQKLEGLAADGK